MARRNAPKASRATASRRMASRAKALLRLRPRARHLWVAGAGALVGLAALNATLLQPGVHPAPLFPSSSDARPSALSVRAGPVADPNVRELQSRLKAMGFYEGELDGVMGRQTLAAAYEALDDAVDEGPRRIVNASVPIRDVAAAPAGDALGDLLQRTPPRRDVDVAADTIARDAVVRLVQERLTERGYDPGPVDGMMGSATRTALGAFQMDEGLTPSQDADAATLDALGLRGTAQQG